MDDDSRVTIRLPKETIEKLNQLVEEGKFQDKSEIIRTAIYDMLNAGDVPENAVRLLLELPKRTAEGVEALVEAGDAVDVEDLIRAAVREYVKKRPGQYIQEAETAQYLKERSAAEA